MKFSLLFGKMAVLFIFIAVGLLCQKLKFLDDQASSKMNKLVIYICSPCLIIKSVFGASYSYAVGDALRLMLFGAAYNVVTLLVSLLLTAVFRPASGYRKSFAFLLTFNNCVFMGFPVIAALFGDDAVFLVSVFNLPSNLFLYSVGSLLLSGTGSFRQIITRALLNPLFFATVIALVVFFAQLSVPGEVVDIFSYLGNMVVPLSMMLIGASLGFVSAKEIFADIRIYKVSICRLILVPLLVYCVMRLMIRDTFFLNLVTVLSVMPCAAVSPIFCSEFGGDPLLASKSVFMTTLLALVTAPLMLAVLLT